MSLSDEKGTPGGFVCLVDGDGNYNLEKDKMTELIEYIDPKKDGSYTIVGIMGCQSTGKSTLLNRLFGTQFAMMNETVRRGQTTKGIWLDAARNTQNLMIADLEGTDSGERGEDRTTFERQTILYALAICEILIINMWETDIGRYTASNHGILKTVFEVNMQLFKSKTKTQLLFIIRDYNEDGTPFVTLRSRLIKEMQGIWDDIQKPAEFQNVPMSDCFDCQFTYLPHYIYRRDKFEEMAKSLQLKFTDPNNPDSYFATEYHHEKSRSIPSSDFAHYSESIWHTIKTNQDLNLPTQREMLATYRCDELVTQILTEYQTNTQPLREQAMVQFCPTLGDDFNTFITQALTQYDTSCEKYIQEVVQRKRVEFKAKLYEPVAEILALNLKMFVFNTLVQQYEADINRDVTPDEVCFGIMDICQTKTADAISQFNTKAGQLTQGLDDTVVVNMVKKYETDFIEKLVDLTNILRKSQLHALVQTTLTEFDARSDTKITELFTQGQADMWAKVGDTFNLALSQSFGSVKDELNTLAQTDLERENHKRRIIEAVEYIVFDKAQRFVQNLPVKIRDRFESLFVYNKGQLRVWKGSDDPRALFESSRDEALQFLRVFATFNLRSHISREYLPFLTNNAPVDAAIDANNNDDDDDDNSNVKNIINEEATLGLQRQGTINTVATPKFEPYNAILITRDDIYRIETDFERKIQGHLQNAIIEVERIRTQTGLPSWVYALLLFLGYDEILWALSNPFVLFFLMLIGIGIFILYQLHMIEPAMTIAKAIGNRLLNELNNAIDPTAGQNNANNNSNTSITAPTLERRPTAAAINVDQCDTISTRSGVSSNGKPSAPTPKNNTAPNLAQSTTLDLNTLPNLNAVGGAAAAINPIPPAQRSHVGDALSGNSLRKRPNYGTMTMNKRNMAALHAAGADFGYANNGGQ